MRVHVYVREGERIKVAVAWFGSHPPGDKGDNKEEIFDKHAVFWHMSILKISFKTINISLYNFLRNPVLNSILWRGARQILSRGCVVCRKGRRRRGKCNACPGGRGGEGGT